MSTALSTSGGNRPGAVFVSQTTGVRQTGENVLPRQSRIIFEQFFFRLTGSEKFEDELDREARPPDHRFTRKYSGVEDDVVRKGHD